MLFLHPFAGNGHKRRCPAALAMPVLLLAAGLAHAAPADKRLSAEQLVQQVLASNASLASLRATVEATRARVIPAGALPDPEVSAAIAPETIQGARAIDGRRRSPNIRLEFSQALPWPGKRRLRSTIASQQADAANDNVAALRLQLAAQTRSAFAEWHYVHRALHLNSDKQVLVDELRTVAEERYGTGLARQQDVLQAEVELQHLQHRDLQLQRQRRVIQAHINALLNQLPTATLPAPEPLPAPAEPANFADLSVLALARHPELAELHNLLAANRDGATLAQKDFYPDFRVFAGYNSLLDAAEKRWIVGAGINLPLSRDKYRARLTEQQANGMRLQHDLADRRASLLSALQQAHAMAAETAHSVALYTRELLPLTGEYLSAARDQYRSGAGAFSEVIAAEQQQLQAQLELARAEADHYMAMADLTRWAGGNLPESGHSKEQDHATH